MTKLGASLFRRPQLNFQTRLPELLHIPLNTLPNADNSNELSQHRVCLAITSSGGHLPTTSHRFLFPSKPQEVSCRVGCLGFQKIQLERNMPTHSGREEVANAGNMAFISVSKAQCPIFAVRTSYPDLASCQDFCRFNSIGVSIRKSCPQL